MDIVNGDVISLDVWVSLFCCLSFLDIHVHTQPSDSIILVEADATQASGPHYYHVHFFDKHYRHNDDMMMMRKIFFHLPS